MLVANLHFYDYTIMSASLEVSLELSPEKTLISSVSMGEKSNLSLRLICYGQIFSH